MRNNLRTFQHDSLMGLHCGYHPAGQPTGNIICPGANAIVRIGNMGENSHFAWDAFKFRSRNCAPGQKRNLMSRGLTDTGSQRAQLNRLSSQPSCPLGTRSGITEAPIILFSRHNLLEFHAAIAAIVAYVFCLRASCLGLPERSRLTVY